MINRLEEQGISSTAHLATADPIKLLLRTGFEWKTILDMIDQAILFGYVSEKIEELRPIGIRGACEVLDLDERLEAGDYKDASKLVPLIAEKLEQDEVAVQNLILALSSEPLVDFIRTLWGEIFASPSVESPDQD